MYVDVTNKIWILTEFWRSYLGQFVEVSFKMQTNSCSSWAATTEHIWRGVLCFKWFFALSVPVSGAERAFSKLKLVKKKNNLRATMSQVRFCSLAMISIVFQLARKLDFKDLIDNIVSRKAWRQALGESGQVRASSNVKWLNVNATWYPDSLNKKRYVNREWLNYIMLSCVPIHAKLPYLSILCNLCNWQWSWFIFFNRLCVFWKLVG